MEILPLNFLDNQDIPIFGKCNVVLGQLKRAGMPVAEGVAVTAPNLHLKTVLEHFDFSNKEVFEQTLTLVKEELKKKAIPDILLEELKGKKGFWVLEKQCDSTGKVWELLIDNWVMQIKTRIWQSGFYQGIGEGLEPQTIIFAKKIKSFGKAYFDLKSKQTAILIKGQKLHPNDLRVLDEVVKKADKLLRSYYQFDWILDKEIKITGINLYNSREFDSLGLKQQTKIDMPLGGEGKKVVCAEKVFVDFSRDLTIETEADGVYLALEGMLTNEKIKEGFDQVCLKIVELSKAYPEKPIMVKMADISEGMGGVRGALRLLHQKNLFQTIHDALNFVLYKKGVKNINIIIPFVRNSSEVLEIKRELAVVKLSRRNSLKHWMEIAVPENIINLEEYILTGLDGVVFNLDELLSHLTGFDLVKNELAFYKKEIRALVRFLHEPFKILHKAGLPVIAGGSLVLDDQVMEFLVEKGVYGVIVSKADSLSMKEILYQVEKRVILKRTS